MKPKRKRISISRWAERQFETNVLGRFEHLTSVKWFIGGWIGLLALLAIGLIIQSLSLSGYYQTLKGTPGGIYKEGIIGQFTNANPLYASSEVDQSVSHLIFSGLLKYDSNGKLAGDLASNYQVSDNGAVYTIHLRSDLRWQDGQPLTSADVVFTYHLIQNPNTESPLEDSWQGIKITAPDAHTVVFRLPGTLASFPYSLTTGIVPEHLLDKIAPSNLRSASFNTSNPIGSGPFKWQAIQVSSGTDLDETEAQIALTPYNGYEAGKPKLQQFVIHTYPSQSQLIRAFASGQLSAAEGLNSLPANLAKKSSTAEHDLTLRAADMIFFKTSTGVLSDTIVRHALVQAANVPSIISHLSFHARAVNEPLLNGQIGYNASYAQPNFDLQAAKSALYADGWIIGKNGIRTKTQIPLTFTLSAADTPDDRIVGNQLVAQWHRLGVKLSVDYLDDVDFQNAINYHDYDAVLDGITIGEDPDVFAYWDSSQADVRSSNRLNLSEYKSAIADASLEAGRSRLNPIERAIKYMPFLQAWQQDSPALALYQPRDLYITNGQVYGLDNSDINSATDRYANVQNWEIRQSKVTN